MNILFVITGLGLGGAEKVVIDLAEQIHQKGHKVKIAFLTGSALLQPKFKEIEIISLKLNSFKDIFSSSRRYRKLLNNFQPDIVHAHMVHANLFTRLNRIFFPIPRLINSAHSSNEGGKIRMLAYKYTNHLADVTTNVSDAATRQFELLGAVPIDTMITIYNGIDLKKFKAISNQHNHFENMHKKNILCVGRLTDPKDYPNLINAISILKEKDYKSFHVFIAGEGDLRKELESLIDYLNLNEEITLLGRRDDVPYLMNSADLFILSSKFEGLPTVIIEAMACEKFIIATNCGGVSEVMGDTGIIVPPQNSEALAHAIEKTLLLSPEEIRKNGKKARQRVEKLFSLEASVNKWLELYNEKN